MKICPTQFCQSNTQILCGELPDLHRAKSVSRLLEKQRCFVKKLPLHHPPHKSMHSHASSTKGLPHKMDLVEFFDQYSHLAHSGISEGLEDFGVRIHHKRPVFSDLLFDGLSG